MHVCVLDTRMRIQCIQFSHHDSAYEESCVFLTMTVHTLQNVKHGSVYTQYPSNDKSCKMKRVPVIDHDENHEPKSVIDFLRKTPSTLLAQLQKANNILMST